MSQPSQQSTPNTNPNPLPAQPSLLNPSLPTALSALRQTILPPPTTPLPPPPTQTPTLTLPRNTTSVPGQNKTANKTTNVLALIPTANASKSALLREHLTHTKPAHVTLHFATVPAESGVGEQPYGLDTGVRGGYNRVVNAAVKALGGGDGLKGLGLEGVEVGGVVVGAVENFIERPAAGGTGKPVDYGFVVFVRVGVDDGKGQWEWRTGVSAGVTLPVEYWKEAEGYGFEDGGRRFGKVTVGEVLAANVPGLDKADWHLPLAGRSRYELLREAMAGVEVPWPVEDGEAK